MSRELKFTLTITGKEGKGNTKFKIDFDPPINTKIKDEWEGSVVLNMANVALLALRQYMQPEKKVH